ncbi:MAG: hypothetical protein V3574_04230 [Candidatus Moraniibacteriota bacterium]
MNVTDKFIKGARKLAGTIDSSGIINGTVDNFGLSSASGLPTDTPVEITVDRVDSNGNLTPDKEEVIKGIVDSNRIINAVRGVEGTAQSHQPGAVFEVRLTSHQWGEMVDGIQVEHNPDGTHKNGMTVEEPEIINWDGWSKFPKNSGVDLVFSATDLNTISVAGYDLTGVIQRGDKLKLTNDGTVKYYYVSTAPVFSTDTTFDVAGEVDLVAGAITLPFFSKIDNPQGFKKAENYYRAGVIGGTQTIADNTQTKIAFNAIYYDPNSNFNTSLNRYVAPISGYYRVVLSFVCYDAEAKLAMVVGYVRKNNVAQIQRGSLPHTGNAMSIFSVICDLTIVLSKGDYIEGFVLGDTTDGGTFTVTDTPRMEVTLLNI